VLVLPDFVEAGFRLVPLRTCSIAIQTGASGPKTPSDRSLRRETWQRTRVAWTATCTAGSLMPLPRPGKCARRPGSANRRSARAPPPWSWRRKIFEDLSGRKAVLLDAGKMRELAALHLKEAGVTSITVVNRTQSSAAEVCGQVFGHGRGVWEAARDHKRRRHRPLRHGRAAFCPWRR